MNYHQRFYIPFFPGLCKRHKMYNTERYIRRKKILRNFTGAIWKSNQNKKGCIHSIHLKVTSLVEQSII